MARPRKDLGLSVTIVLKLHPDQLAYVQREANRNYCTQAEMIRRLITDAMRHEEET